MVGKVDTPILLGRAKELALITAALTDHRPGPRGVVLTGDAGVGKSSLLSAVAAQAAERGAIVLGGACVDVGETWPFYPIHTAVQDLSTRDAASAATLGRILDPPGEPAPGPVMQHLHRELVRLAHDRAVVLILDDLQWVDENTKRLVLTVLADQSRANLFFLAAVGADHLGTVPQMRRLLVRLRRLRSIRMLDVGPLAHDDALELAAAMTRQALPESVAEVIWERSAGNPLIIEEIVRTGPTTSATPETLRSMTLGQLDDLGPAVRAVVRTICIGVGPVSDDLLRHVTDQPDQALAEAVRAALDARLITPRGPGLTIRHQMLKEVVESDLLPAERRLLHRRFAEGLELFGGDDATYSANLAHHWLLAGQAERALPTLVRAAEGALRQHAYGDAWQHWRVAIDIATSLPMRASEPNLLRRAAGAAQLAGDYHAALALLDRIESVAGQPPSPSRDLMRITCLTAAGRLADAERLCRHYADGTGAADPDRAAIAARTAELLVRLGKYSDATNSAELALVIGGPRTESTEIEVIARSALGLSRTFLGNREAGEVELRAAIAAAERTDRVDLIGTAYLNLTEQLLAGPPDDLNEGVRIALLGAARAEQAGGGRTSAALLYSAAATGLFRLGQWAESAEWTSKAIRTDPTGVVAVDALLARVRLALGFGDLESAESDLRSIETLLADGASSKQTIQVSTLRSGLAIWRRNLVRARAAVRHGLTAIDGGFEDASHLAPLVWHGFRVEAESVAAGEGSDSDMLDRLDATARRVERSGTPSSWVRDVVEGYVLLCAAERTRIDGRSDPAGWGRAADHWADRSHPYPSTYARYHRARALLEGRSRGREARELLTRARTDALRLNAVPLRLEIEALASRAGIVVADIEDDGNPRPTRHPVSPALSRLTPREIDVLSEVAGGRTDREIGQILFISQRTVGVHVSHILAKLGARSRLEAATIFLRAPTTPQVATREGTP
ncbi:AAA family ATPase [Nakamurella sp.]|uniref:helix-turn-helix transcriptional regulator n=1 Tax=Nakamurella sp. TaxID=1869182 RepID=UPI003783BFA8